VNDWRVGAATAPSRLGFRGSEDLGGGLKALFTMESGMSVDTGTLSQGSRIFGRQAFVGLSGPYGALTFGRQYTMRYWSMWDTDLFGSGAHGLGTLDTGIPSARADNSVSYRVDHAGFGGGVNYSVYLSSAFVGELSRSRRAPTRRPLRRCRAARRVRSRRESGTHFDADQGGGADVLGISPWSPGGGRRMI